MAESYANAGSFFDYHFYQIKLHFIEHIIFEMRSNMKQTLLFFLLIVFFGVRCYVKGDMVFYTDRSVWEAAVNSDITIENFDSVPPYFLEAGVNPAGLVSIELLNHSQVNEFNSISDNSFSPLSINGSPFFRGLFHYADTDSVTRLILPSAVYAFGGDFVSAHSTDTLAIEVNGKQYLLDEKLDPLGDGDGFLGFISSQAFSGVSLFDPVITDLDAEPWVIRGGESFGLDNVSFAVPEPITLGLLGAGVRCFRRRR